jgi:flavin-dependent dehydrogenase
MLAASEIAVVGGGPAGAIVAIRLAALGHDVVLLEGVQFPRPHVGEALTPGVGEQLAFLKLGDVLDSALAHRTSEFELRWRTDSFESYRATPPGLLVERGIFDAGLVAAARRRGVRLLEATRARIAERVAGCWRIACDSRQGTRIVTAALVIDAGGRRGLLPKRRHKQYGCSPSTAGCEGRGYRIACASAPATADGRGARQCGTAHLPRRFFSIHVT